MTDRTKEYVFQFQRFGFEVLNEQQLLASAREVRTNQPPRPGHAYPRDLDSTVDAIDVHLAAWGLERMNAVPGARLVARSGRTVAYDLSEAEFEDSFDDPFLWGANDDADE